MRSYRFDPNLDIQNNAFTYAPSPEIDIKNLPPLPNDWLEKLCILCGLTQHIEEKTPNPFEKHVTHPKLGKQITEDLQLVYHCLAGNLDKQLFGTLSPSQKSSYKQMINYKLREDIEECSEGYSNRIQKIILSFQRPENLQQLLTITRMDLVQKTSVLLTDEVHADNRCFKIASIDGLGVSFNNQDKYVGNLSTEEIRTALQTTFYDEYRAFNLPFLLSEVLRSTFAYFGYSGKKETGYEMDTYQQIHDYMKKITGTERGYEALFQKDTEEKITDVNWHFVQQLLYETLHAQSIIKEEPTLSTLLDCANYSKLFSSGTKEEKLTRELTDDESPIIQKISIEEMLHELRMLKKTDPEFYGRLMQERFIQDRIIQYIQKFQKKFLKSHDEQSREALNQFEVIISVWLDHLDLIKIDPLSLANKEGQTLLTIAAKHSNSTNFNKLIKTLSEKLEKEKLMRALLTVDKENWNAIMLAIRYQKEVGKFIEQLSTIAGNQICAVLGREFSIKIRGLLFDNSISIDILMLAAIYQSAKEFQALVENLAKLPGGKETIYLAASRRFRFIESAGSFDTAAPDDPDQTIFSELFLRRCNPQESAAIEKLIEIFLETLDGERALAAIIKNKNNYSEVFDSLESTSPLYLMFSRCSFEFLCKRVIPFCDRHDIPLTGGTWSKQPIHIISGNNTLEPKQKIALQRVMQESMMNRGSGRRLVGVEVRIFGRKSLPDQNNNPPQEGSERKKAP
ncbi:MAG: hypothetical protein ACD_60C00007G0020 [uncultured bacterium]|nr:MAG: hypothetical protein ACD_60C00007G0020 [uncultured bacterium]